MSQPLRPWTSVHVIGPYSARWPLGPLAAALPRRWWHTPGRWSDAGGVVPATEFTVASEDMPEALEILLALVEPVCYAVSPTLLSESLEATAHEGWTDLLTYGSDRLARAAWECPDVLIRDEVAAVWHGLGGTTDRCTRGVTYQLRWLGAALVEPPKSWSAPPGVGALVPHKWASPEELPLEAVARLAHLQATRVCAAAGLTAGAEIDALRSLLTFE